MLELIIALISGIIFALGLVISGMTNPTKVIGFLDIFGNWDYSLAFVMVGAIGVTFVSFKILSQRKPFCAPDHFLPTKTEVDKKVLIGSALFGIGWGISGICPGPGIVNLVTNESAAFLFVGSLIMGMFIFKMTEKLWR
jgi:uncharacterized membrane protein YedE/YeeE